MTAENIKIVIQAALFLIQPVFLHEQTMQAIDELAKTTYLLGKATLQRARCRIECSFMLLWRSFWKEMLESGGVSIQAGIDASPHRGRHFETTVLIVLKLCDCLQLRELIHTLERM